MPGQAGSSKSSTRTNHGRINPGSINLTRSNQQRINSRKTDPGREAESFEGPSSRTHQPWIIFALVTLICLSLFGLRLVGPPDLMDNDQERPAAYAMDILRRGNWIVQRDHSGAIMSKPPLSTWLTALISLPFPRFNLFLLYLPCALAALAIAWLILGSGSVHFGRRAAFLGASAYLLSAVGHKQIALARTDSLFAALVFGASLLAYRAWNRGSGWTLVWLVAAAATLTKGPLAVVLAFGGLLAAVWEGRSGQKQPLPGSQVGGIILFLLLTLGWFLLAYRSVGTALTDKMLWRELAGHAVRSDGGKPPGLDFYKPFLYFLSRFAPWSLLACLGFWRIWKRPADSLAERRFERFLLCYFLVGLVIFSLAPHQRPDHLWPLIPAAALLAGRELAGIFRSVKFGRLAFFVLMFLVVFLSLARVYDLWLRSRETNVINTRKVKEFAGYIRQKVGDSFPLIHVDSPYTLQFYLNTMIPRVSAELAGKVLSQDYPAFVVTRDPDQLKASSSQSSNQYTLARWSESENRALTLVSNHPSLEPTERLATLCGPLLIQMEGISLSRANQKALTFLARKPKGLIRVTNQANHALKLRLEIPNLNPQAREDILLEAGRSWSHEVRARHLEPAPDSPGKRYGLAGLIFIPLALILWIGGCSALTALGAFQGAGPKLS